MPAYKFAQNNDDDSEYESDGETVYTPEKKLGTGNYATARRFQSSANKNKLVVLKPVDSQKQHLNEAKRKYHFFKTLYPESQVELISNEAKTTYRLILPEIPGQSYQSLPLSSEEELIHLFLAASDALLECHMKNIVLIDLKEDNIYYDKNTQKAYLIDGGFSEKIYTPINPEIFRKSSEQAVSYNQRKYIHIAPECWSTGEVYAAPAMDIFSLGTMMSRLGEKIIPSEDLSELIKTCGHKSPLRRPDLPILKNKLQTILQERKIFVSHLHHEGIYFNQNELGFIFANKRLKETILLFIQECNKLNFGKDESVKSALALYKINCLKLAATGKDSFQKNYPAIARETLKTIDNNSFKKFLRWAGNIFLTTLATVTVVGLVAMILTSKNRGGFLFFQDPEQKLKRCAAHLEDGLKFCRVSS